MNASLTGVGVFSALYVASIVFVNWAFGVLPVLRFGSDIWSPASIIVGAIFILRDFAQRELGHRVLLASLLGIVISYVMADPRVATASAIAFGVSEATDWAVFSLLRSSFRRRVVLSSLVGVPVDTACFLGLLGFFSWTGFAVMVASKLVALAVVFAMPREQPFPVAAPE